MLLSGAADFMMIYWHPGATVQLDPAVYHSRVVGHDRFLPVAAADAKGQPIFRLPGGPQERLPFLAYTPDAQLSRVTGSILRRQGAAAFLEPVCVNSMALILKAMAMAGHGVAWLPRACIEEELAAKVLAAAGGRIWHSALEIRLFQPIAATGETSRRIWAATEDDVAIEGPEELA
jgi:DNA-binding transcriptional LysR family regulator